MRRRTSRYDSGAAETHAVDVPVVSVGNLTVGGTGKTPFVIWLAQQLAAQGLDVGIASRGYRGAGGAAFGVSSALAAKARRSSAMASSSS